MSVFARRRCRRRLAYFMSACRRHAPRRHLPLIYRYAHERCRRRHASRAAVSRGDDAQMSMPMSLAPPLSECQHFIVISIDFSLFSFSSIFSSILLRSFAMIFH
jgi:hypothetical protein